jgi:arylformamidase
MKIYRDYDQQQLDAQYNLRARFADHPKFLSEWQARGEAERARPGWHLDLAYGPSPAERLDLIAPLGAGRRVPLFVFFHGGYWQALDKRDCAFLAPAFAAAGAAFATVNYALAPMVGLDEIVRQARSAIAWLWRQAPLLGCNGDHIVVAGHSAGGHIAAMLAATDWAAYGGLPPDLVKAAFSVSGVYDLEPLRLSYQNPVLKLDEGTVKRNSPLHLAPRTRRLVLTVGEREPDEFQRQQAAFAAAWEAHKIDVEVVPAKGLHHFDILAEVGNPQHPIGRAALDLVAKS